jgi:hypothetical protein
MLLVLCMLAVWIFLGVSQIRVAIKDRGARRWLTVLAAALIMIGALGFFGTALSALGALSWLPASFEWPIGLASGVVTTGDRYYVVPHTSSGRVQVYDRDWKFLRGWSLVSGGTGGFKLYVTDTNHVHVVTLRGRMHYTYDLRGKLLTSENYADIGITYASFPDDGVSCDVPTPIWLWFFSSPLFSWFAAMAGMCLLAFKEKKFKSDSCDSADL